MTKTQEYFQHYPAHDECFQTADGWLFHNDYDAKAHARSLENKVVTRHTRPGSVAADAPSSQGKVLELPAGESLQPLTNEPGAPIVAIPQHDSEKGIHATAPVVAEENGEVISPAEGETSTSPVAATQTVTEGHEVVDAGKVDTKAAKKAAEPKAAKPKEAAKKK